MAKKKKAAKKKAAKKKAPKKKKAAKKKKKSEKSGDKKKKEYKPPVRLSMKDLNKKYKEAVGTSFVIQEDQFDIFAVNRIYTPVIDVDLVLKPAFGKRICVIGDESVGKTVMCYILEGSAQKTCRDCFMPIIEWHNPANPTETKVSCKCGNNNPMVVLHIDAEDSFDPPWASGSRSLEKATPPSTSPSTPSRTVLWTSLSSTLLPPCNRGKPWSRASARRESLPWPGSPPKACGRSFTPKSTPSPTSTPGPR
jgi:hypothetical protein